jgi:serine protease Do
MKKYPSLAALLTPLLILALTATPGCLPAGFFNTSSAASGTVTATATVTRTVTNATATVIAQAATPGLALPDLASVIARVRPSVVAINTEIPAFGLFGTYTDEAAGSGWIISKDGLIVTNNHVVEGASNVTVTLEDGREYDATAVHTDPFTDLAIVQIDAKNLPALSVGDSSIMRPGDWVIAIGNSLGLGISATKGIVSAMGVSITTESGELYNLIQTDAAINPGNSGGPLVNLAGEVIGISSAKVSEVGVEGMGYAISTQEALPILNQLIATGKISRPAIGAELATVDATAVRWYRLGVSQGVLITKLETGGPAQAAGLKAGDVITQLEGKDVASQEEFSLALQAYKVGQQVKLTYFRGTAKQTATVTLKEA